MEDAKKIGVPHKVLRLIQMMLNLQMKVCLSDELTDTLIIIIDGIRQGNTLSVTLFIIALDPTIKATTLKGLINIGLYIKECLYHKRANLVIASSAD